MKQDKTIELINPQNKKSMKEHTEEEVEVWEAEDSPLEMIPMSNQLEKEKEEMKDLEVVVEA